MDTSREFDASRYVFHDALTDALRMYVEECKEFFGAAPNFYEFRAHANMIIALGSFEDAPPPGADGQAAISEFRNSLCEEVFGSKFVDLCKKRPRVPYPSPLIPKQRSRSPRRSDGSTLGQAPGNRAEGSATGLLSGSRTKRGQQRFVDARKGAQRGAPVLADAGAGTGLTGAPSPLPLGPDGPAEIDEFEEE